MPNSLISSSYSPLRPSNSPTPLCLSASLPPPPSPRTALLTLAACCLLLLATCCWLLLATCYLLLVACCLLLLATCCLLLVAACYLLLVVAASSVDSIVLLIFSLDIVLLVFRLAPVAPTNVLGPYVSGVLPLLVDLLQHLDESTLHMVLDVIHSLLHVRHRSPSGATNSK